MIEAERSVRLRRGLHTTVGRKVVLGPTWETTVQKNVPAKVHDVAILSQVSTARTGAMRVFQHPLSRISIQHHNM